MRYFYFIFILLFSLKCYCWESEYHEEYLLEHWESGSISSFHYILLPGPSFYSILKENEHLIPPEYEITSHTFCVKKDVGYDPLFFISKNKKGEFILVDPQQRICDFAYGLSSSRFLINED